MLHTEIKIVVILLCFFNGIHCIPLEEFFDYGDRAIEAVNIVTNGNDFSSNPISPEEAYFLYGIPITSLIVSYATN